MRYIGELKNNGFIVVGILVFMLTSCTAPVNLNYESARTLKKGEVELGGHYSGYNDWGATSNRNIGGRIGYGVSDKYNVKLSAAAIVPVASQYEFEDLHVPETKYFEIDNKLSLTRNLAVSLPFGLYSVPGANKNYGVFDPRIIITGRVKDVFEVTVIPKVHVFFGGPHYHNNEVMPAISIGFGFSNNLNKWAIRPEIGIDTHVSAGIGIFFIIER